MPRFTSRAKDLARAAAYSVIGARRVHRLTHGTTRPPAPSDAEVVERFHKLSYDSGVLNDTYWLGSPILKSPQDCWTYQEILHELRPDLIVETGTYLGGSARFFASICDLLGHGRVITIDDRERVELRHPRITALVGSSLDPTVLSSVRQAAADARAVLVVLDSDHRAEHVLNEMRAYAPLVTVGSYLVVEDTNVNGHPVHPQHGPGPMEAVERFLETDRGFVVDRRREKFLLTYFPGGWLKRIRAVE